MGEGLEDFAAGSRTPGRKATRTGLASVTAVVVRTLGGVFVAELDADATQPIGPCFGPVVQVGDQVLLVWTDQGPWVAQVDRT